LFTTAIYLFLDLHWKKEFGSGYFFKND